MNMNVKAYFTISATEEGIDICVSDLHERKAYFSIEVTEEGIENVIFVSDEHELKEEYPIEVTEDEICICVSDLNEWKWFKIYFFSTKNIYEKYYNQMMIMVINTSINDEQL